LKKAITIVGLFLASVVYAGQEAPLPINKFGGLDTDTNGLLLTDGKSPAAYNVKTDEAGGLAPRDGYIAYATEPSKGLWIFSKSDGTRYIITHSGNNLKADTGTKTFPLVVSTVAASISTVGSQLGDYFYFSNLTDGLKRWDGSSVSVASDAMKVDKLVTWKGRLVGAGKTASPRTVFFSKYLDGLTWNLETNPTDDGPSQIVIGGALDENLSGLYASFKDLLMVFKPHSFGGFFGSRRSNFQFRTYSDRIGTTQPDTVTDCDGLLRWLTPERDVYEFNGDSFQKIMEDNDTKFDTVINGESTTRTQTITSQADYALGASSGTSTTASPGDVVLSTFSVTEDDYADFSSYTSVLNLIPTALSGTVIFQTSATTVSNFSFETGGFANWTAAGTGVVSQGTVGGLAADNGSNYAFLGGQTCSAKDMVLYFEILDDDGTVLETNNVTGSVTGCFDLGGWTTASYSNNYTGRNVKVRFRVTSTVGTSGTLTSDVFLSNGNTFAFKYSFENNGTVEYIAVDNVNGTFRHATPFGTYTSTSFDSGFTSPIWLSGSGDWTTNGHTVALQTQVSSDDSSWDSAVNWSTGSAPTSASKRYIRYVLTMSTTNAGSGFPYLTSVTLGARQSSGVYVSESRSLTNVSAWSVADIQGDISTGGSIVYGFYTDTDAVKYYNSNGLPATSSWISSQTIINGQVPSLSTSAYAFFSVVEAATSSNQNPANNSLAISWTSGSSVKAKGLWTNQRYWLAVGIDATTNNRALVYDRREEWQEYRSLSIDAMLNNNADMLFGNTSGIWLGQSGTSDNGSAIAWNYTTKVYSPAGMDYRTYLNDLWLTTTNSDASLTTVFYPDGGSAQSLATYQMNAQTGYQNFKLPFSTGGLQSAKFIAFGFSGSSASAWQILNASLYHQPDTVRD
jgi:hypothetical protein